MLRAPWENLLVRQGKSTQDDIALLKYARQIKLDSNIVPDIPACLKYNKSMSTIDKFPTPENNPSSGPRSPEEAMSWHPEPGKQESPEFCAEKIAELEALFVGFQSKYDLESLRAITRFMTKDERRASPRAQALIDIAPLFRLVNFLESQNAVSREAYESFNKRFRILSNTIIGALRDSPDGIGEIVVHLKVNDDGTLEELLG
ncbi:MAG: hypothetical protein JWN64_189 [Parcubacteria group bacterium]|nr:hypothetical protein [Parcubacteria group bacterium]